ncbi:response regulator transcription factor [Desnuesiella massiliensis]|uniref:response regulator transcription factor n=1 Tax=Desnuesiella massiliensis TaxID=1650662 RepID=UPI0006E36342|nr:response regulator transcription factor [Desnuesiella massiliensis]
MNKKILIVEDEIRMRILIRDYFIKEGFIIYEASDGEEGLRIFEETALDILILDIMLPRMDGFSLCRKIRELSSLPIVLLTAKSEEEDKLLGYELGADDYITKPFSPKVLVAKVKALLKRTEGSKYSSEHIIDIDGLYINRLSHEVKVNNDMIYLSPKEYELLLYLIENKGIVLNREKILDTVWGYDFDGDLRAVDTNVKRLREKLKDKSELIATVRGIGYRFEVK